MKFVLLIFSGGVGVPAAVLLIARHLVLRHAEQYGQASAAQGRLQVANAEAARRAAVRALLDKEMAR